MTTYSVYCHPLQLGKDVSSFMLVKCDTGTPLAEVVEKLRDHGVKVNWMVEVPQWDSAKGTRVSDLEEYDG